MGLVAAPPGVATPRRSSRLRPAALRGPVGPSAVRHRHPGRAPSTAEARPCPILASAFGGKHRWSPLRGCVAVGAAGGSFGRSDENGSQTSPDGDGPPPSPSPSSPSSSEDAAGKPQSSAGKAGGSEAKKMDSLHADSFEELDDDLPEGEGILKGDKSKEAGQRFPWLMQAACAVFAIGVVAVAYFCLFPPVAPAPSAVNTPVAFVSNALAQALAEDQNFIIRQLQYRMQMFLTSSFALKMAIMFLMLLPIAYIAANILLRSSDKGFKKSFLLSYAALVKLPGFVAKETEIRSFAVLNFTYIFGLLTFGLFQGFVTSDVRTWMNSIKDSNLAVLEQNHTIIFGWNEQAIPVLRQAAAARHHNSRGVWSRPVVVAVDGEAITREEVEKLIATGLSNGFPLEVIAREVDMSSVTDMKRVGVQRAKTIIRLVQNHEYKELDEDMQHDLVAFAATIKAAGAGVADQTILLQQRSDFDHSKGFDLNVEGISSSQTFKLAKAIIQEGEGPDSTLKVTPGATFAGTGLLEHFLGHCAVQPGLGSVLTDIYSEYGHSFHVEWLPHISGQEYGTVRRSFTGGTICGFMKETPEKDIPGQEHLTRILFSPQDSYVMQEGDSLIFLARSRDTLLPALNRTSDMTNADLQVVEILDQKPQNIVLLGGKCEIRPCLRALAQFAPPGSKVTVMTQAGYKVDAKGLGSKDIQIKAIEGSIYSDEAMKRAGAQTADTIIITGGNIETATKQGDTMLLNCLARLRSLRSDAASEARGHVIPLRVVACVSNSQVNLAAIDMARRSTAAGNPMAVELITTSQLTGGHVTQVAQNPDLRLVLRHLVMDRRGCEIYIRPMSRYPTVLQEMEANKGSLKYTDVCEYLRRNNETVIGFVRQDGTHFLNPENKAKKIYPGDSVISIAEE